MALVNILNITSAYAKVYAANLTTSYSNVIVNNTINRLVKVESVYLVNYGPNPANISLLFTSNTRGLYPNTNTSFLLVGNLELRSGGSMVAFNKDTPIYLQENETLVGMSNNNTCVTLVNVVEYGV